MSTYSSFLIRCWTHREGAEPKFVVEHVQSGEQFRTSRMCDACQWIEERSERPAKEEASENDERA